MAKNKITTYLLIAAVTFVWGMIIYQIYGAVSGDNDEPVLAYHSVAKKHDLEKKILVDTGELDLKYPDPFRASAVISQRDTSISKPLIPVKAELQAVQKINKSAFGWPAIRYSGYIRNPKTRSLLALITIGDQNNMLNEGESTSGVKLIRNMKDSIKVSLNGHQKVIPLNGGTQ